jgi:tripartite-type tricarboxylate transporter receptor subunit TctC
VPWRCSNSYQSKPPAFALIAWLKANPDKASAAMVGTGGIDQIAGTYFQQKTGTRFQFVSYRGGPPIVQDLIAGHIDMWLGAAMATFGQVRSGQLKAYAVFGNSRWFAAPDIPSAAEAGLPDLTITFWIGLWAPKGTPKDVSYCQDQCCGWGGRSRSGHPATTTRPGR